MPVVVVCPACKARLKAPETLIGKTVKCPGCAKPVLVKASVPAAPSAARSAKQPVKRLSRPPEPIEDEPVDEAPPEDEEEARPRKKRRRDSGNGEAGAEAPGGPSTEKERGTAMWIHLLPIVLLCCAGIGTWISLFMWLGKRKESAFIDHHGKTWLNFLINLFVAGLVLGFLSGVLSFAAGMVSSTAGGIVSALVGLLFLALSVYSVVMAFVVGLKAKKGEWPEYRVLFKVLK
jgi:uncharacterized Tic20 family protein